MTIAKDPRYDVLFCDPDSSGRSSKTLGLVLRESGGGVDFGVQAVSPYANRVSQGDLQDSDFSRGTVRTQRDWTGGFGKLFTYQETDSFLEGTADTRFKNQVVLGPKIRKSRFYTSTNPQYLGEGVSNATTKIQSQWTKRTSVTQEAYARWEDTGKQEKSWQVTDDISPAGNGFEEINGTSVTGPTVSIIVDKKEDRFDINNWKLIDFDSVPGQPALYGQWSSVIENAESLLVQSIGWRAAFIFQSDGVSTSRFDIHLDFHRVVDGEIQPYAFGRAFGFDNLLNDSNDEEGWIYKNLNLKIPLDRNEKYVYRPMIKARRGSLSLYTTDTGPIDFAFRADFDIEESSLSEVSSGKYVKWSYKNTSGASKQITKVYIDCAGINTQNGTVRVGGGTSSNLGPTGQNSGWSKTITVGVRRSWVEVILPASVTVANNGVYWMFLSVVATDLAAENECKIAIYKSEETGKSFFLVDYAGGGSSFSNPSEIAGHSVNFLVNTLVEFGDPDTRAGSFVLWKQAVSSATTVSSVSVYLEATEYISPGSPVYLCVSKTQIAYFDGQVNADRKILLTPSGAQWWTATLGSSLSFSANEIIYMGVISTASSAEGKTTVKVYGSERDGFTNIVSVGTIAGLNVSFANATGCVYFKINGGTSAGFHQWSSRMYTAREVHSAFTFNTAFASRNHTLRLKIKVNATTGFVPKWTAGSSLKISIMDGTSEFASKTFSFSGAFPNNVEDTPFSTSEKWVAIDFGTKSSTAKTYTIKVSPVAVQDEDQFISLLLYGSADASAVVKESFYSPTSLSFTSPTQVTPSQKMYYSFFSSDDLPTRDTSISASARPTVYWHEYFGTDRRIAWTIKSKDQANWGLNAIRFHARLIRWDGGATVTLRVYTNNNGLPSASPVLSAQVSKESFLGVLDKSGWVTVSFTSYTIATANSLMWVSLECDTPSAEDKIEFDLTCGETLSYTTVMSSASDGVSFGAWSVVGPTTATVAAYVSTTRTITTTADHSFLAGMKVRLGSSDTEYTISARTSRGITLLAAPSSAPTANTAILEVIDYDPIWVLNEGSGSPAAVERPPFSYKGKWYCFGGTQMYVLNAASQSVATNRVSSYNASLKTITLGNANGFAASSYVVVLNNVRKIVSRTSSTIVLDEAISPAPVANDPVSGVAVWEPATSFNHKIECAAQLGDHMYVGFGGQATCMRGTVDGSGVWTFANILDGSTAVHGSFMRQHLGYLYISKSSGGESSLRATNGNLSKWDRITVGTADIEVTALASLGANLIVLSKTRMFEISSIYASHMYNYEIEANTSNGRGSIQWVADGKLYIPIKNGLNAFDGVRMTPAGPDQEYGLPNGMQGSISCMSGTKDFLYASVDAGASGYSSVLAFNGKGWHIVYKSPTAGKRIQAIGVEALVDARPRLWIFEGLESSYITFPSLTDNPYAYVGAEYDGDDYVISSWFGGELSAVIKDMQSVFVRADGCTQTCKIVLDLEADNSGAWCRIGEVTESPSAEFNLDIAGMTTKTIRSFNTTGLVKTIYVNETLGDVSVGEFVSVNGEVRQVKTVGSGFFTLAAPLTSAPAVGDYVFPSRPVGKEFRYRATLVSNNASLTPKLVRISFRMQEYTMSRFRFSLSAVVDDEILLRTGAADMDMEADDYRSELYSWMKRTTPFTMVAPDGKNWRVKIMGGSESTWTRKEIGQNNQRFSSIIQLQLDEV